MDMAATSPFPLPLSVDHMNQTSSTPYIGAASSPPPTRPALDFFFGSAPTSPRSHTSRSLFDDVYDDYSSDHVALLGHNSCNVNDSLSFDWELKPEVAKTNNRDQFHQELIQLKEEKEEDFQFDFSGQLDMMVKPCLSSADELFDGGKIRPLKLKPPPSLQINHDNKISSYCHSQSPKSTMSKLKDALSMSPKHRRYVSDLGLDHDSLESAILNTRKSYLHSRSPERECKWDCNDNVAANAGNDEVKDRVRGRDRVKAIKVGDTNMNMNRKRGGSNSRAGISRSLSPLRVSEFALLQHQHQQNLNEPGNSTDIFGRGSSNACSKKWRLKDLFLFRSASEGHYKDTQSFSKRWSFRPPSMASVSESGSGSKRRGKASTHEMIYTKNRAVSEELRKKTMLPYKHGLLACLGFNPTPQFSYVFSNTPS